MLLYLKVQQLQISIARKSITALPYYAYFIKRHLHLFFVFIQTCSTLLHLPWLWSQQKGIKTSNPTIPHDKYFEGGVTKL
jgi:hypothetical protein